MLTALRKSRREMCTAPARGAQPVHCRPNSDPRSCDARCATDGVAACERGNYRPNAQLCQARGAKQPREPSGCTHPGCIRVAGTRAAVVLVPSTKVAALAAAVVVVVDQDAPTWQRMLQRRSNSSRNANGTLTSGAEIPPRSCRDGAEMAPRGKLRPLRQEIARWRHRRVLHALGAAVGDRTRGQRQRHRLHSQLSVRPARGALLASHLGIK